jgi:uncharacterized membrane protein
MKAIIMVVLLIIVLVLVGWIYVGSDGGNPSVNFDTQKAKKDTAKVVEVSKELIAEGKELVDETADKIKDEPAAEVQEVK